MEATGPGRSDAFDREAAERVMRRAIDLVDDRSDDSGSISAAALLEAADELGVDPGEMQRAMAEERMGLLTEPGARPGDRVLGPERIGATRVVDGDAGAVLDLVDRWLRRAGSFRRVRRDAGWAEYHRRTDIAAHLQRTVRFTSGGPDLTHIRRIRALALPAGADRTLMALVVDVATSRATAAAGGVAVGATGLAATGAAAVAWMPWAWFGIPVAAAAGVGVMAGRKAYVGGIDVELESLLDSVASGTEPASVVGG
ncbi:MAG: hypothetical protein ACHQDC_06370, partial [Acidimicrobiales bacterium]